MKLGRFRRRGDDSGAVALGAVFEGENDQSVLDLARVAAARPDFGLAPTMNDLIGLGAVGVARCEEAMQWALRQGEPGWVHRADAVDWQVPLEVRNCIAAGRNFDSHVREGKAFWDGQASAGGLHHDMPSGFIKLPSVLVPDLMGVERPAGVVAFDYEVEVAAVIGRRIDVGVAPERALEGVFGYTVFNDLSAREWSRAEMKNQMIALGKNFPGAGPLGPWILTADEVPDPQGLEVWLSVNGELRQQGSCREMIFSFAELIAHWSRMGLDACDLVTSGTPEGVAISRKPDPAPFFLKPGDVVEAACRQIGTVRTRIL